MITFREQCLEIISQLYPFSRLPDHLLENMVDMNPIRRIKKGKVLYEVGDEALALYVLIKGTIGLNQIDKESYDHPVMALNTGDLFGYETIQEDTYQYQAVAWSDCLVLELSYDYLESTAADFDPFKKSILFLANSLLRSSQTHFQWRNLEENILYASRRHWVFMVYKLLIPIFLFLGLIPLTTFLIASHLSTITPLIVTITGPLIILAYAVWVIQDWRNDYAVITNQRVVWQEKVILLYESRQEAPLDSVLAVSIQTSALGRIFSYGNVIVRTYAGLITLSQIPSPNEVAALLESQWEHAKKGLVRADQFARVEQMIKERLFHTAETVQISAVESIQPEKKLEEQKTGLFDLLAEVFQLRTELKGMVIYRTHWWLLLRRTILPILGLMLLAAGLILNIAGVFVLLSTKALMWLMFLLGGVFAGMTLYEALDWKNDVYFITNEYLIDVNKKPLGLEQRKTAPLKTVQSVEFERVGLPGLLLNFGTVSIRVGETTLTFDHVYNPAAVQRELFLRISERERLLKKQAVEEDEQRLTDWIEVYHHLNEQQDKKFTENI
jgi:hypothetical protein